VVEAEAAIASLRAERETIAADEPILAAQLREIEPELRELLARRGELGKQISKLKRAEDESVVRSAERVAAARAHKLVVDRAAKDMSREQNELLTELGEALYDDPPPPIVRLALPLKERVVTLARLKDRAVSLREERASIERMPLLRGAAVWLAILGVIGAVGFLLLAR
jgi:chorismate mutase